MKSNSKKFRAILIALAITFSTNYAISFALRGGTTTIPTEMPRPSVELRGGTTTIPTEMPRPSTISRGGTTTIPTEMPRPSVN